MKEKLIAYLKIAAKSIMTVSILTMAVYIVVWAAHDLHDFRVMLGIIAGAAGYRPIKSWVDQIKTLQ